MRYILIIFSVIIFFPVKSFSSHIVGGEFELLHLGEFDYEIRLIQYFDEVNGNPQAKDLTATAYIYRKADNAFMDSVILVRKEADPVNYSQQECVLDSLVTTRLVYTAEITLPPDIYHHEEGYYLVWERCCRNYTITNIALPEETGQTFYLEFPPVVKDNIPFINSSPSLLPPVSDYACVNHFFQFDFSGVDYDGDSLVYSLVTPYNSSAFEPYPQPKPGPHAPIAWAEGIDLNQVIPGNPPLGISPQGLIKVKPAQQGLYVFSVRCEEYRDKKKIGEMRRDFQILVLDCEAGQPPEVLVKIPGEEGFYNENETIKFLTNEEKCFEFLVTDMDGNEPVTLKAIPVNFEANIGSILSVDQVFVNQAQDTLQVDVCLPDCPYLQDEPFLIDLVAMDDACSQPLTDTIRLTIEVEPPPNNDPYFTVPDWDFKEEYVDQGVLYMLDLLGKEDGNDGDQLIIDVIPVGFDLADYGMSFLLENEEPGEAALSFLWDADCQKYDFSYRTNFELLFVLDDLDQCNEENGDTVRLNLKINLPLNNNPITSTDLDSLEIEMRIDEEITFHVFGEDADPQDFINLIAQADGFNLEELGMTFSDTSGLGMLSSVFYWKPDCNTVDLNDQDEFIIHFITDDQDFCKLSNADTLSVRMKLLPPLNTSPVLTIEDVGEYTLSIQAGDRVELKLLGIDNDGDSLIINILESEELLENLGIDFTPAEGRGNVTSYFIWPTSCDLLETPSATEVFDFTFLLQDDKCFNEKGDTLNLEIILKGFDEAADGLELPNVFTPNGDNFNDYFKALTLPPDDCNNKFENIKIYNRWGKMVFHDRKRGFEWDGENLPAGVYYYYIKYTNKGYKGMVSILY